MPTSLPSALVCDANVVLSTLIGGRARLIFAAARPPACFATVAVAEDVGRYIPRLSAKRGLDPSLLMAALSMMPITWVPEEQYAAQRDEALRRIGTRDASDWPAVALALARSLPIWSQDRDMEDAGVDLVTTGMLLDELG